MNMKNEEAVKIGGLGKSQQFGNNRTKNKIIHSFPSFLPKDGKFLTIKYLYAEFIQKIDV